MVMLEVCWQNTLANVRGIYLLTDTRLWNASEVTEIDDEMLEEGK